MKIWFIRFRQSNQGTTIPETEYFSVLFHHLQYGSIAAFFDFQNEKIFSFQVGDFRQTASFGGGLPDRRIPGYAERGGQQSRWERCLAEKTVVP